MRTLTLEDVANAPKRSFSGGTRIAQDVREWYSLGDRTKAAAFKLGEKEDTTRDGSDAQLRDAICSLAGLTRTREAVLNEDGSQATSEKRGKPIFREVPFSTKDRLEAMRTLGIHERELSREGKSRLVALVWNAEDEDEELVTDEELEESDEDE